MNEAKETRILRQIAAALARDLTMSYQKLANEVGVSRRTLYRLAPTREALFERLRQQAIEANAQAIALAKLECAPFPDALRDLTREFVANATLFEFWAADTWGRSQIPPVDSASDVDLHSYHEQMARFFRRGQEGGFLRTESSVHWLLAAYDGLLFAASSCRRRQDVPVEELTGLVIQTFLGGMQEVSPRSLGSSGSHGLEEIAVSLSA